MDYGLFRTDGKETNGLTCFVRLSSIWYATIDERSELFLTLPTASVLAGDAAEMASTHKTLIPSKFLCYI